MASNNRSPSRMSSRPRTPELNHPVRRSFNGSPLAKSSIVPNPRRTNNPMTPSKSPSDFGRRSSIDNEKENDRDYHHHNHMKMSKIKSPAAKGMKNFMSSTISAASKMNSASPRKHLLGERNELVRSFDGKNSIDTLSCVSEEDKIDASSESDVTDLTLVHKDVGDKPPRLITSLESNFKISPRADCSPCPIIAPLDADPSVPPYDPKTNYLSPRPQFLHYKPNPRIQVYLNKKGLDIDSGEGLEELFMFESSSDTDITDETQSEGLTGESDDASSVEEEIEEVVFELSGKQPVGGEGGLKRKSCMRMKYLSWIMIFAIAFASMSVSDTPVIGNPVHTNMGLSEIYCLADEAADFAKEHLAMLVSNFEVWRKSSVSYLSKLVFDPYVDNLAALQYGNITTTEHDDQLLMSDFGNKVIEESYQVENGYGQETDSSDELVAQEEAGGGRVDESEGPTDAEGEDLFEETYSVDEETAQEIGGGQTDDDNLGEMAGSEVIDRTVFEVLQNEQTDMKFGANDNVEVVSAEPETDQFEEDVALETKTINFSKTEKAEDQQDSDMFEGDKNKEKESSLFKEESVSLPQISQIQPKMLVQESMESQGERVLGLSSTSFEINPETSPVDVENEISEGLNSQVNSSVDGNFARYMVGISSLILAGLAAATAFSFAKQTKPLKSNSEMPLSRPLLRSSKSVTIELTHAEVYSPDCSAETEVATESWNSGMSSTQKGGGAGEVQSQQRKTSKRESFASSDCSMSSSYGSFTTYEILHKKIQGDEETIVTPVRRSSRIRKQVTSP